MMVGLKETEAVVAIGQNVYANDLVTRRRVNCSNKRRHLCLRRKAAWGNGLRDITIIKIYIYFYTNTLLPRPPYKHPPVLSTQIVLTAKPVSVEVSQ
jgi:hypothetical protein